MLKFLIKTFSNIRLKNSVIDAFLAAAVFRVLAGCFVALVSYLNSENNI